MQRMIIMDSQAQLTVDIITLNQWLYPTYTAKFVKLAAAL